MTTAQNNPLPAQLRSAHCPSRSARVSRSLLLLSVIGCLPLLPASAQNSITVKGHQLEQVSWPKARLQLQVVDESPEVRDCRRRKEASPNYAINISPLPPAQTPPGTIVLTPERSDLPTSGFFSQIPAGGMGPGRALPAASMGGHAPTGAAAFGPRPIMDLNQTVNGRVATRKAPSSPPATAAYQHYQPLLVGRGDPGEMKTVTALHAVLIEHDRAKPAGK